MKHILILVNGLKECILALEFVCEIDNKNNKNFNRIMPRRRTQASAAAAAGGGDASDGDGGFYAPQPAPQSTTDAASRARRRGRGGKSGDAELDDGRSGSDTAAVAGRKAQRKHAAVKCHLCGRGGHLRAECPGLDDGGSGQSKYKGKYSRRPGRSEANEPKEPQPWWPAEAAAVAVDDWGCRLHRLFERERHRGTLGALRKKAAEQWPPRLRRLVCVVDEPGLLLPDAASPWYHFWEDADCTAEDGPAVQLAFGVAPADAAVWGSALRAELVPCLQLPQCIAVGVVGLDFAAATQAADRRVQVGQRGGVMDMRSAHFNDPFFSYQLEAFLQQLQLAKEHKLIVLCSVTGGAEEPFGLALQRELPAEWPIVLTHYRGNDPDWLYR